MVGCCSATSGPRWIKIERLGGEETRQHPPLVRGQSVYFSVYNRGKTSVCIDLRNREGEALFGELVKKSDIVLENFLVQIGGPQPLAGKQVA